MVTKRYLCHFTISCDSAGNGSKSVNRQEGHKQKKLYIRESEKRKCEEKRNKDKKTQRQKDTKTQRQKDTNTQRQKDTNTQRQKRHKDKVMRKISK